MAMMKRIFFILSILATLFTSVDAQRNTYYPLLKKGWTDTVLPLPNYTMLDTAVAKKAVPLVYSGGNRTVSGPNTGTNLFNACMSVLGKSTGKYYVEVLVNTVGSFTVGICTSSQSLTNYIGSTTASYGKAENTSHYFNAVQDFTSQSVSAGGTIMICIDLDNHLIWWGYNGTWDNGGDPSAGTGANYTGLAASTWFFGYANFDNSPSSVTFNFGDHAFTYPKPTGAIGGFY